MSQKVTADHLQRGAVVYVRQSSMGQVLEHTESQRRQYALAETARSTGFVSVTTIDDDLGRSGSGLVDRPGFQRLVASVCTGSVGAVFCIEASRLARNGRDWHHLIDLCALVGALVIDTDGVYDPRLTNDRLLLGLKGTMSEYELNLLQQRGLAARDSKAKRGELRFRLPPGYCWNDLGRMELDPDERVVEAVRLVFRKFRELGTARQVYLWMKHADLQMPVVDLCARGARITWKPARYSNVLDMLRSPLYAGAYVFGRTGVRTHVVDGRAKKTLGHRKPRARWSVLLRDHHPGFITWDDYERNHTMLTENAHRTKSMDRKSARGGRALLTGLVRCGRCARMMRVIYGRMSGHAHRYQCLGDDARASGKRCIGIGGVRIDQAVAAQLLDAVAPHAIDASVEAAARSARADEDVRLALGHQLQEAKYEASLAARRHGSVDPEKRLVARELEARWDAALKQVTEIEERIAHLAAAPAAPSRVDRTALLTLAHDLHAAWNAPTADPRTKQRLMRILVHEVLLDLDNTSKEVIVTIHWTGGRHTELRVTRVRGRRYDETRRPSAVEVMRKIGDQFSDRDMAATMNRMRCTGAASWTTERVCKLRERLGIPRFDPVAARPEMISINEAARRLSIAASSVRLLIRGSVLSGTQAMPSAPWRIPAAELESDAVRAGVQALGDRCTRNPEVLQDMKTLRLPGLERRDAQ
jgi:DNA invertase Pin-like site-specific DNA recombinase